MAVITLRRLISDVVLAGVGATLKVTEERGETVGTSVSNFTGETMGAKVLRGAEGVAGSDRAVGVDGSGSVA